MATASEINEIIKLYVGYYNRAPDPIGLNFWISAFDGGFSLEAMAADFSTQPETVENYPFFENDNPSNTDYGTFVDAVYGNLFNRSPDDAGKDFWVSKLASGEFTVGRVISLIIEGATGSPDKEVVENKVAVGLDFYTDVNALPPYTFDEDDITEATAIQAGVTDDPATVATAAARTDEYITEQSAAPGQTINLTTAADVPGGSGQGSDTQGGSGDDTYAGTIEEDGEGTLQSRDTIAGAGGEDTLNVRLIGDSSGNLSETVTLNATGLEKVVVTDQVSNASGVLINIEAAEGITELTLMGGESNSVVAFDNADQGTALRMIGVEGELAVNFEGDRSSSSDDSFSLYVEGSGTSSKSAIFNLTEDGFNGTDEDFEIAAIETGGSSESFLNLADLALDSINVTGSSMLSLEDTSDGFEELEQLDASAMTGGGVGLDATGSTEAALAFTGSDFDDNLILSNALLSSSSTLALNGGDGSDTLMVSNFTSSTVASINRASNFEVLESQNASTTLEADDYTGIDTFVFAQQSTNGSRLNIRSVTDDDLFIFKSDAGRTDEFIRFEADSVGQSLTFEMRASSEDDGQIEFIAQNNNNSSAAIGFTGSNSFEAVNIISSGSNEDANLILSTGNNGNYFAFDNDDGPTNFNISGSQDLIITAAEGVELTSSDRERGFSDSVNLDASSATGDLRLAGSAVNDAIEGGSGDDIIYGLGGDDILTGNSGADQFRFSNNSGTDELRDFVSGEDKIGLNRVDFSNTTATAEGATLSTEDYVENVQSVANITGAEDDTVVELQNAASQTQIEDTEITGEAAAYLVVFNSTSGKGELWFDAQWQNTGGRDHIATFDDIDSLVELTGLTNNDFVEFIF